MRKRTLSLSCCWIIDYRREESLCQFQPVHAHHRLSDVVAEYGERQRLIVRHPGFSLFENFCVYLDSLVGPIHFFENLSHVEMQQKVSRIAALQELRIIECLVVELLAQTKHDQNTACIH